MNETNKCSSKKARILAAKIIEKNTGKPQKGLTFYTK